MSYCHHCGQYNTDDAVTCAVCKTTLTRICTTCQNRIPIAAQFCPLCGTQQHHASSQDVTPPSFDNILHSMMPGTLSTKINQAMADLTGERREATVLCWAINLPDIEPAQFTNETRYLLNDRIIRLLAEVIYEYEGTIDRYSGDYLVAFFGTPVAHENDAERAIRAALVIQSKLQHLIEKTNAENNTKIATRIGVHTGKVIVSQTKQPTQMNYSVVGNIIDHAELLRDAADPNTILASFETYQRTHPLIQYHRLPLLTTRSSPDLVWAFRPTSLKVRPGRIRGIPGSQTPMIGREDALHWLQTAWQEVVQSRLSRVVLVTGEAGVGKTRLVNEFCQEIPLAEGQVYLGSCMTYSRATPLHLIKSVLRDMLYIDENKSLDIRYKQLQDALVNLGVQQTDVLPYLSLVLGLEESHTENYVNLNNLDDAALQKLTHAAIRQVIEAISQTKPTALVFEDLHWVDSASRSVIDYMLQTLDHSNVLLILISRSSERETVLHTLIETAGKLPQPMTDIRLNPLSPGAISELIAHLMPQTSDAAGALINQIVSRADGNPLFAEEIVRMLVDHGGIHRIRDKWYITNKADELIQKTPGTLGDLILARFDQLDEVYRTVLYKAAACGLSFTSALLSRIMTPMITQIEPILDLLVRRQFLIPDPDSEGEYFSFRHALIREVIYGTLLRKDRQQLHSEIAVILENDDKLILNQERIEILAYHYAASTTPEKAVRYLLTAADNATRRCDYETAIKHYRDALKNPAPKSPAHSDDILEAKIGLGRALKFTGAHSEASEILLEALQTALYGSIKINLLARMVSGLRELAEIRHIEGASDEAIEYLRAGITAIEDKGKQENAALWRSLIDRMAWIRFRQGELEQAFELAGTATLGLNPQDEADPMTLASLYNTLGGVLWEQGNLSEAVSYVELSSRLYVDQRYIWGMANTDVNLGILYYAQGAWQNAAQHFTQADQYWVQMGDLQHRAVTLNNLGTLRQAMGQSEQAEDHLNNSLELFQRLGDIWGTARVHTSLARLRLEQSDTKLANEHVQKASALYKAVGVEDVELHWIESILQAESDLKLALRTAERGLELARETDLLDQEAECLLALGKLRKRAGDYQEAESLFRESVDLNLQAHAPYGLGLAMFELGSLYQLLAKTQFENQEDWHSRALDMLRQAVQQFSKLGAARDLARARKAISEVDLRPLTTNNTEYNKSGPTGGVAQSNVLPEGEQRQATIVNIGISPSAHEDEEDVFEALTESAPIIAATAQRYHGQVIRQQEGMMLIFGAPQTYEDDPERAVQAAWEILEHLSNENSVTQRILRPCIAITQGQVVAGYIGPRFHTEFMVEGEPVEEAKQLARLVPSGEIWGSNSVKQATDRIALYHSVDNDNTIWRLDALHENPGQVRGIPGLQSRLIGRESALTDMTNLTKYLSQGVGGLIWIEGEPGIGKSRLMNEFVAMMSSQGNDVWQGRCSPQSIELVFSLFTDLLAQRFAINHNDPALIIHNKVSALFDSWPRNLHITRPYLEVLLGAWPAGLPGQRLAKLEPEQLRQQIFVSLRRFFKVLSQQNPLIIIMDDLHWIDTISAELLQFLLTLIATSPIFFVCAQRRQGSDAPNDRLVRIRSLIPSQTLFIPLQRLTESERELLLDELLPKNELPESIRTAILSQSDGNPYFIEEFIRMLVEQGYLSRQQDRWVVNHALNAANIPLPASLDLLIRARIDALPVDLKQVIHVAAVIGAPFDIDILGAVCGKPDINTTLDRLASRLLVRKAHDDEHWTFHHPLIEGVAYKSILNIRRQAYHQAVADFLEARWAGLESEHAEVLAYHLTRANQSTKALSYLITAGERAAVRFANEEAGSYFEQAAHILGTLPGTTDLLRWRLAAGLGDVYRAMGQLSDSMAALHAGMVLMETGRLNPILRAGLYRRMGDTTRKQGDYQTAISYFKAATLMIDEPGNAELQIELSRTFTGLAWAQFHQGLFHVARETAEKGLVYAEAAGSVVDLAAVENLLGGIAYSQSEWASASQHTRRAMVLREQMGYTWGVASTLGNLGILAVREGEWHRARSFFERSLSLREEMDDAEGLALVHNNLGMLLLDQGDLDNAEKHFRDSLEASKPFAHSYHTANATLGLANVLLLKDDLPNTRLKLSQAMHLAEEIGANDVITEAQRIEVEICSVEGKYLSALEAARANLERAKVSGNRSQQACLWRLISNIELAQGNIDNASDALEQAEDILDSVTNMLEFGRVHTQAARIAMKLENHSAVDTHLQTAQGIFMKLGAELDLAIIHKLAECRNLTT